MSVCLSVCLSPPHIPTQNPSVLPIAQEYPCAIWESLGSTYPKLPSIP